MQVIVFSKSNLLDHNTLDVFVVLYVDYYSSSELWWGLEDKKQEIWDFFERYFHNKYFAPVIMNSCSQLAVAPRNHYRFSSRWHFRFEMEMTCYNFYVNSHTFEKPSLTLQKYSSKHTSLFFMLQNVEGYFGTCSICQPAWLTKTTG